MHTTYVVAASSVDAGAVDGCAAICAASYPGTLESCEDADAATPSVTCHYLEPCAGRVPEALVRAQVDAKSALARHWAVSAHLEAASVVSFERLASELDAHGAPSRLVRAARRAARDEVRHAALSGAVATRLGAEVPEVVVGAHAARSLEALAIENAVEGCVRETYGSVAAHWQARTAASAETRALLAEIARDEVRHARLAWDVAAWADARLDDAARARVTAARDAAVASLREELRAEPAPELCVHAGVPCAAQAGALADALARDVWA